MAEDEQRLQAKSDRNWHMISVGGPADNSNVQLPLRGEDYGSLAFDVFKVEFAGGCVEQACGRSGVIAHVVRSEYGSK